MARGHYLHHTPADSSGACAWPAAAAAHRSPRDVRCTWVPVAAATWAAAGMGASVVFEALAR